MSPVHRDSLFAAGFGCLIPFISGQGNISAFSMLCWSKHTSKMLCDSPAEGRAQRESERAEGRPGNPPSITDEPIIKEKLLYTSLGYANSKLDACHQKISSEIFCIYKLKMSSFKSSFNINLKNVCANGEAGMGDVICY